MARCKQCNNRGLFLRVNSSDLCPHCVELISQIPSDYTVIDLETTGLNPWRHEILEIGAIKYRAHKEIDRFHTYVIPTKSAIPAAATAVNGITWETVLYAPPFEQVKDNILNFISQETIVGYNIRFDLQFIQMKSKIILDNPTFDVLSFMREISPNEESYKLDCLRSKYALGGIPHTSLGDCEATVQLMQHFLTI
ncbi:MAG: 3'-5' exonuclease [Clostridiales bacterium]|nr:3'-5' exonuclease [Clostridiales bacterium]